jgi:hypothetical protein
MRFIHKTQIVFLLCVIAVAPKAWAQECAMNSASGGNAADSQCISQKAKLSIAVSDGDSVWIVSATLLSRDSSGGGTPVVNATITFFVKRLFGLMPIGKDDNTAATDDNGVAQLMVPKDIPGDASGVLTFVAQIEDNALTGALMTKATGAWGRAVPVVSEPFPRELWEPRAPIPMIITFCVLLGGVWITYGFVLSQLFNIKKGSKLSHENA